MDCQRSFRARAVGLRLSAASLAGLWLANSGCTLTKQETAPVIEPPPAITIKPEKDHKRKLPQAATCVAIGDMRMHFASEATTPETERERLLDEGLRSYQQ